MNNQEVKLKITTPEFQRNTEVDEWNAAVRSGLLRPLPRTFGNYGPSLLEEHFTHIVRLLSFKYNYLIQARTVYNQFGDRYTYGDGTSRCTALIKEGPKSLVLVRRNKC